MATPTAANMVSFPTLDLLLLTFNCAKTAIDVPVFAARLQQALADGAGAATKGSLPDLVVISLQEVSPMAQAFAGSYFLSPYLARFDEALNKAAGVVEGEGDVAGGEEEATGAGAADGDDETARLISHADDTPLKPYRLVQQHNVGMTALLLFARGQAGVTVGDVQLAQCGFGVADMGNKGAAGIRVRAGRTAAGDAAPATALLTFVAAHLAPMEWNVGRRNANWRSMVAGLTFGDPRRAVAEAGDADASTDGGNGGSGGSSLGRGRGLQGRTHDEAANAPRTPAEEEEEGDGLLSAAPASAASPSSPAALRLSIYHPDGLLFVLGDLNYRIGDERPPPGAVFPDRDNFRDFLPRDQLTRERLAGRTLHGLREAAIAFPPTYKYDLEEAEEGTPARDTADDGLRCKYAAHRWPSWCDRVLYLDVPAWTKRRWAGKTKAAAAAGTAGTDAGTATTDDTAGPRVQVQAYSSLPLMRSSDHQPVYLRARVPLLAGENAGESEAEDTDDRDPRRRLPVPIDTDAWARRVQARRREWVAGMGMLLFNTREGAMVMGTAVMLVLGAYALWVLGGSGSG